MLPEAGGSVLHHCCASGREGDCVQVVARIKHEVKVVLIVVHWKLKSC